MKYAILSEKQVGEQTHYKVILQADDGYEEIQEFIGDEATLEEATRHFNKEWLAAKALKVKEVEEGALSAEPEFVTVTKD